MTIQSRKLQVDQLVASYGDLAFRPFDLQVRSPAPGELRRLCSYPRLVGDAEEDGRFERWCGAQMAAGWRVVAAMHNDSRGTISVHMEAGTEAPLMWLDGAQDNPDGLYTNDPSL